MPNPNLLTEIAVRFGITPIDAQHHLRQTPNQTALKPINWRQVAPWRFAELIPEGIKYETIEPGLSISTCRTAMVDIRHGQTILSVDIRLIQNRRMN
jgi:hypothetical protein